VRQVDDEVRVRHRAGAQDGGRTGGQADQDEAAGDELDDRGPPTRPHSKGDGASLAERAAEHPEQRGGAVAREEESDDDPEQRRDHGGRA
jgi:hypothetical protein